MQLTPTTELEAVNQMLQGIGESPISNLANSGLSDAATARQTLRNISRQMQARGWHWNTDVNYELTPSVPAGFLYVPTHTLKVDTTGDFSEINVVLRGNRLYQSDKATYVFDKAVKVDIVTFLDFEELPEPARNYVTLAAARRFQESMIGSQELSQYQRSDEMRAWADLLSDEADSADFNMMNNYAVARVLDR